MKIKKFLAVFLLAMLLIAGNVYSIKAAGNVKILDSKYNIAPNHEFTVKFSQEIDETSIKEGTVKIYEKATLKPIEIVIRKDINNPYNLKVKGKNEFEKGKTYTLEVRDLKSKKNKFTKQITKMDFTVKNLYSGLPAENGLIIVDDKAYAIDYLIKNIRMVNEIITKTYDIYYTYDVNYEKIYSLFKTGPVTGNTTRKYDEMTYIDPNGNRHMYKWRTDRQEYQLVEPKANVDIIVRSDAKAVNINVKSVSAVPDAKYYKIKGSNLIKNFGDPILYVAEGNTEELSILSQDKSVLAKGILSIDRNNSGEVRLRLSESLALGNSAGNINNNGIAAGDSEGYIYYVNNADKEKLYKLGMGGVFNRMILEDKAQYVNESGDWLYFSNYSDGGKLYKVKKDGTERQKLLDDKAAYITISGEYIYYSNHTDGGKLYKIKKDASDAKISPDNSKHGNILTVDYGNYNKVVDEVAYLNAVGDWIYYSNYSDGHKPYVIHKDGTYRGKLSDSWADSVQVVGDWVYFTSGSGVISKVNKSGEGNVIPIKATTAQFNKGYQINVDGDWILYSNSEDGGKLYKINTDGSGKKIKLADEAAGYINVVGEWIYFNTPKGKLYRIPRDTNSTTKPEEVGVIKDGNQVVEIQDVYITVDYADVNKTTEFIENKYLPDKVPAIMKDNTIQQLVVVWDTKPASVSFKDGIRVYKGTVVGYSKTINLYMTIPSEMLNDTNRLSVYKNGNKGDMLVVEGNLEPSASNSSLRTRMKDGDVIKVYEDSQKKKLLGTATVGKDGKATVNRLDLDSYGRSFFVTITRVNKAESKTTEVKQYMPSIISSEDTLDNDANALGLDLRDMTLNNWIQSSWNPYEENYLNQYYKLSTQEIYLLPTRTGLDMLNQKPVVNGLSMITKRWDGTELTKDEAMYRNKDSKGIILKSGKYDVYVAASYTGLAAPDVDNNQPLVQGKIANSIVASFDMMAEGLPAKPTITEQRVQGGDSYLPNAFVTLNKPLMPGEEAWLVPMALLDRVRGWRADMGPSPFEQLLAAKEDVVKFTGNGVIMPSPIGDKSPTNPIDMNYKLFIVNAVGASPESDNKVIVDNSKPNIGLDKLGDRPIYDVGDPIAVRSNEKGKIYVVKWGVDLNPAALEEAYKSENALMVQHRGSNLSVPVFKTETLIDFTTTVGSNVTASYNVVVVDDAGNISSAIEITIRRDFSALADVLDQARKIPTPSPELLASIKKGEQLLVKPLVKQSEIKTVVDEILSKIGRLSNDTTLSSNSSNIIVDNGVILASQMSVAEFRSKLITKNGASALVLNSSGQVVDSTSPIDSTMIVQVTAQDNVTKQNYSIRVVIATPTNTQEFIDALKDRNIEMIRLLPTTYDLNEAITINRDLIIEGSSLGTSIIDVGPNARLINQLYKVQLSRITFRGSAINSNNFIENSRELTINSSKFVAFDFSFDNQALIYSKSGAKLVVNATTFSELKSVDTEFSFIHIDEGAATGTKVDSSIFTGMKTGKNVKGVKITGSSQNYNEIFITKNTFSDFASNSYNSMATPIYVDGGRVNLASNVITNSEAGIWLETSRGKIQIGSYVIGINGENAAQAGGVAASANRGVSQNYYGDIMVAKKQPNQLPIIYYNSTATPTIGNVTFSGDSLTIVGTPATGNKFMYKSNSVLVGVPRVGTAVDAGYVDYAPGNSIDTSVNKYITVVEVDKSNKIVKFRQIYIP